MAFRGGNFLQLRGVRPFFSNKYDITKHKNYPQLSDSDPRLAFDIEKFVRRRLTLKKNEEVEVFEADAIEEAE